MGHTGLGGADPAGRVGAARREWFDQPRCFLAEHLNGHWDARTERRVSRALALPPLPRRRPRDEVWGVSVVRDEADIIELSVAHLLDQGVDHVLVADHLSRDGTTEKLRDLAQHDPRVHVVADHEPGHFQKEKVSRLARAAWRAGARWVVPFDADEFWFAPGQPLARYLLEREATVVSGRMVDLLPLSAPVARSTDFLVDRSGAGPRKVAFRAHPLALVGPGNHGVAREGADEPGLIVAHVPYRGPAQMRRKFALGASALRAAGASAAEGWHWVAGERYSEDQVAERWEAMRRGDGVEEIGWRGVDRSLTQRVLEWTCWPLDGEGQPQRADLP